MSTHKFVTAVRRIVVKVAMDERKRCQGSSCTRETSEPERIDKKWTQVDTQGVQFWINTFVVSALAYLGRDKETKRTRAELLSRRPDSRAPSLKKVFRQSSLI